MLRWILVCLLSVGVIIGYVDRTNLSIALASPDFKAWFHLTDSGRGLLNSAFFWSYALLQVPAGYLVDRFGVKRPLAIALFFWCLVSAATAWASLLWQLVALRLLLGVCESVIFPGGLRWIRHHIGENQRGLASGVFVAGTKWGPAIAAPLAAWLLQNHGWRNMFWVMGIGGLVWLVPWLMLARDDDRDLERAEAASSSAPPLPFSSLFRTRAMWGTLIGTFCYNYFLFYSLTWLPAYFVEQRHMSLDKMGVYTMFSFGGTAVVAILAGLAADILIVRGADAAATRKWFTIAGLVVASTEVFGALSNSTSTAVFFAILSMSGLGLATANYWALTYTLMPGFAAGRIAGVQNTALNLAGIIAPILTGWLKQVTGSYTVPMQAIWAVLVIGIFAYVILARKSVGQPAAAMAGV